MADIGISYSHQDTQVALTLRHACIEAGLTVWMDDPGVDDTGESEVGIPIGRAHWDVIEREFAGASAILALDSPEWRSSKYCQRENTRCEELGKWVVLVDPNDPSALIAEVKGRLLANRDLFDAHARIAMRAVAGDNKRTLLQGWLPRSNSADARALVSNGLGASGLSITEALRGILAEDVAAERSSRRRLRGAATVATSTLVILVIGSMVGWLLAERFSVDALAAQHRAEARALVEQSGRETDTVKAIADARRALALAPSAGASSALTKSTIADKRLRAINLPPDEYVGASWASSSPIVLAYSTASVVSVNTQSGRVSPPVAVGSHIYPGVLVAGPDGRTAVYRNRKGSLTWIDLKSGEERQLGVESVTAIDISEDGLLWWATAQTSLAWAPYPAQGILTDVRSAQLPTTAKAVDAVLGEVAIVGDDAVVYLLKRQDGGLKPDAQTPVSGLPHSKGLGAYGASISDCGGVIYGSYTPSVLGTSFRWRPSDPNAVAQTATTKSSAPVCTLGEAFSSQTTRGDVSSFGGARSMLLDPSANRYLGVGDPLHERFAELSAEPSRLYVVDPLTAATAVKFEGEISGQFVFDDREWLIGSDERLTDASTGYLGGTVPGTASEARQMSRFIQRLGCDALMMTNDSLVHVDCEGVVRPLPISMKGVRSLRAGADGKHFVVGFLDSVTLLHPDGSLDLTVGVPWSSKKRYIRDADISPDGSSFAAIDSLGVVRVTKAAGSAKWTVLLEALTPGNSQLAYTTDGNLLILGSDRLVRLLDRRSRTLAIQVVPSSNTSLRVSGGVVVLSSATGGGLVIDADTLGVIEKLPTGMFDRQANGTLRGLAQYSSNGVNVTSASDMTLPAITER